MLAIRDTVVEFLALVVQWIERRRPKLLMCRFDSYRGQKIKIYVKVYLLVLLCDNNWLEPYFILGKKFFLII